MIEWEDRKKATAKFSSIILPIVVYFNIIPLANELAKKDLLLQRFHNFRNGLLVDLPFVHLFAQSSNFSVGGIG